MKHIWKINVADSLVNAKWAFILTVRASSQWSDAVARARKTKGWKKIEDAHGFMYVKSVEHIGELSN